VITIRERAGEYLAMRRALGFKLTTWGVKLMSFVSYLESAGATVITTEAAVAWATSTPRASTDQVHWSRRMDVVRIFARHMKTLDPATEIPPEDILASHYRRITPYPYSPGEIASVLARRDRRLGPGRRAACPSAAGCDLADGAGPAGSHRASGQRGLPSRPRRRRP
jgi:integrase/recombinase XerD